MQDDKLAWQGISRDASVVEALHTLKGYSYGVCIVPMRGIGHTRKAGFDTVDITRRSNKPAFVSSS
jgi:hypothetical protein